jgi:hypothetical protein
VIWARDFRRARTLNLDDLAIRTRQGFGISGMALDTSPHHQSIGLAGRISPEKSGSRNHSFRLAAWQVNANAIGSLQSACSNLRVRKSCLGMKMRPLTRKEVSSVPCPTCNVAAGKWCVLVAGGPRNEPHPNREVAAAEAIEKIRATR